METALPGEVETKSIRARFSFEPVRLNPQDNLNASPAAEECVTVHDAAAWSSQRNPDTSTAVALVTVASNAPGAKEPQTRADVNPSSVLTKLPSERIVQELVKTCYIEPKCLKRQKFLGHGAYASVEKAEMCTADGRSISVAVKRLLPHVVDSATELENFCYEADILHKLDHSAVVNFVGVGYTDPTCTDSIQKTLFLVQEYMDGGTLKSVLSEQMMRNPRRYYSNIDGLRWMISVAEGLQYLHTRQPMVIHRDLKPDNILLKGKDPHTSQTKICDFGLMRYIDKARLFRAGGSHHNGNLIAANENCLEDMSMNGSKVFSTYTSFTQGAGSVSTPKVHPSSEDQPTHAAERPKSSTQPSTATCKPARLPSDEPTLAGLVAKALGGKEAAELRADQSCSGATGIASHACEPATAKKPCEECVAGSQDSTVRRGSAFAHLFGGAGSRDSNVQRGGELNAAATGTRDASTRRGTAHVGAGSWWDPSVRRGAAYVELGTAPVDSRDSSCSSMPAHAGAGSRDPSVRRGAVYAEITASATASRDGSTRQGTAYAIAGSRDPSVRRGNVCGELPSSGAAGPRDHSVRSGVAYSEIKGGGAMPHDASVRSSSAYAEHEHVAKRQDSSVRRASAFAQLFGGGGERDPSVRKGMALQPPCLFHRSKAGGREQRLEVVTRETTYLLTGQTGSMMYMAPEVFRNQKYNHLADVFSFGVILYEVMHRTMLMSTVIYMGTAAEVESYARRVSEGHRPPLSNKLPSALLDIISACMAQEPTDRPEMSKVVEMLKALEQSGEMQLLDEQEAMRGGCFSCFGPRGGR